MGTTSKTLRAGGALGCALLATTALTAPALAQALPDIPPPSRYQIDENDVDVARGTVTGTRTDLAIGGEGRDGLAFMRRFGYAQSGHNFDFGLFTGGGLIHAGVGLDSIPFTQSGSTYTVADGSGATLVKSGATYTLTLSDGTVVVYDYGIKDHNDLSRFSRATSITYPSGERDTLTWVDVTWCSNLQDGCAGGTWLTGVRLQAVSSSMGYQLHLNYGRADVIVPNQATAWRRFDGVTAINTTVESCSPSAHSCTLSNSWPTVGYSGSAVIDPEGRVSSYAQNVSTQTYTIRRPSAPTPNITYTHTIAYDRFPVTQVVRDGLTWTYNYSVSGTTATMVVTLPGSPTRTRTIVSDLNIGLPTAITNEVGETTSYQYDGSGRLTRITQPEGNYVQYTYDGRGNLTQTLRRDKNNASANDIVNGASYAGSCSNPATCNQPITTTDARGNVTDYTYNATHGEVETITLPAPTTGAVRPQTRYAYSALTPPGGGTVYRPTSISQCQTLASCANQADETRTVIAYGQANLEPSSVTVRSGDNALSATTAIGYDHIARPITADGPLSGSADTARRRYNLAGQVIGTILPDPDGAGALKHRAQRITYNGDGQTSRVENGTVNSQSDGDWMAFAALQTADVTYDSSARSIRQTLKGSDGVIAAVTDQSYDSASRAECVAQRMNPSAWGTLTSACTPQTAGTLGPDRITRTTYDLASRPTLIQTGYGVTGEQANEVAASYSDNGQVETLTDGMGNRTTYTYDAHDRLRRTYMPSTTQGAGTSSTTDYEELTYLTATVGGASRSTPLIASRRTRANETIGFTYDNLDRLTVQTVPERAGLDPLHTRDVYYGYDLRNLPLYARFDSASGDGVTNTYDAFGRLSSSTMAMGGFSRQLSSLYREDGARTRLTHPDGQAFTFAHDALGRLTHFYQGIGTSVILGQFTYNAQGLPASRIDRPGSSATFTYDTVGRLAGIADVYTSGTNNLTVGFGHNPAGQIVSQSRNNDVYAWQGHYAVNRPYTTDGLNRYTAAGGAGFTYDLNGNLTSDGSRTFTYDVENRLVGASGGVTLRYDPLGRLHELTAPSGTTQFLYDGDALVGEYINNLYDMTVRYVHGADAGADDPLIWYSTTAVHYLHRDHQGSIVAAAANAGTVVAINRYDEYGIPAAANQGRFQYTGQIWLPELGMYHYKARIYSPTLGRFMQTDPIGMAGGINLYAYVRNDPVNLVDPSGLTPEGLECEARTCLHRDGGGQTIVVTGQRLPDVLGDLAHASLVNSFIQMGLHWSVSNEQNVVVTGKRARVPARQGRARREALRRIERERVANNQHCAWIRINASAEDLAQNLLFGIIGHFAGRQVAGVDADDPSVISRARRLAARAGGLISVGGSMAYTYVTSANDDPRCQ